MRRTSSRRELEPRASAWTLAFLVTASAVFAQPAPVGPPVLVDPNPDRWPHEPAVAFLDDGGQAVVWTVQRVYGQKLFVRFFDEGGRPRSGPLELVSPPERPEEPAVTATSAGAFFVAWHDDDRVLGRQFDALGRPLGGREEIGTGRSPAICRDAHGDFVVAWRSADRLYARRYTAAGMRRGEVIAVAGSTDSAARIACAADGAFVTAWSDLAQTCRFALFDAGSRRVAADFVDLGGCRGPRVAATPEGRFAVTWTTSDWDAPARVRFYDDDGTPLGPPREVGSDRGTLHPAVRSDGWAVVRVGGATYLDADYALASAPFRVTAFDADGEPDGAERLLAEVWEPFPDLVLATDGGGHLAAVWSTTPGLSLQVFDAVVPGALRFDRERLAVSEDGEAAVRVLRGGGSAGQLTARVRAPGLVPEDAEVVFGDGDSAPRRLVFTLPDDGAAEPSATLELVLEGEATASPSRLRVEVRDDDGPPPLAVFGGPVTAVPEVHETPEDARPAIALGEDGAVALAWQSSYDQLAVRRFRPGGEPLEEVMALDGVYPTLAAHLDGGFSLLWQFNSYDGVVADPGAPWKHGIGDNAIYLSHAEQGAEWSTPILVYRGPGMMHGPLQRGVPLGLDRRTVDGRLALAGSLDGHGETLFLACDPSGRWLSAAPVELAAPSTYSDQTAMAVGRDGSTLVMWQRPWGDSSGSGVAGALVAADEGVPVHLGSVPAGVFGHQRRPSAAALRDGFLAVWEGFDPGEHRFRVLGRRLGAGGDAFGGDLPLSESGPYDDVAPQVAAAGGYALVVWERRLDDGRSEVRGLLVDPQGGAVGRSFTVGDGAAPSVAATIAGAWAVAWRQEDGDVHRLVFQLYRPRGRTGSFLKTTDSK